MKFRAFVSFAVFMGLLVCQQGSAWAQDEPHSLGKISRESNHVLSVMLRAGCSRNWLSRVLVDSEMDPSRLRTLHEGDDVSLRGSCKDDAPAYVAGMSKRLLRGEFAKNPTGEFQAEMEKLRDAEVTVAKQLAVALAENAPLRLRVSVLESELRVAKENKSTGSSKAADTDTGNWGTGLSNPYVIGGVGVIGGMTLMSYLTLIYYRKRESFLKTWTIVSCRKKYVFTLVGVGETSPGSDILIGKYKCPLKGCSERNVFGRDENLRRHIEQKHTRERIVVEIHPEAQRQFEESQKRRAS